LAPAYGEKPITATRTPLTVTTVIWSSAPVYCSPARRSASIVLR
jgi:hypothetical protein